MAKKTLSYEAAWHTTGTLKVMPSIRQISEKVARNESVKAHRVSTSATDGWWSYDAVWTTPDGARVRGRLNLHDRHPSEDAKKPKKVIDPHEYDPEVEPVSGYFHVYAEADRRWDPAWPSPLSVFLDRKAGAGYSNISYLRCNAFHTGNIDPASMTSMVGALSEFPWAVAVFTNEVLSAQRLLGDDIPDINLTPLIPRLPASMYGRVIDMRVVGETARCALNRVLKKYGTQLPKGGAAVVLAAKRRKGLQPADLSFSSPVPLTEGGSIAPLAAALEKMASHGVMGVDDGALEELRSQWDLFTEEEKQGRDTDLLNEAADTIESLKERNEILVARLSLTCGVLESAKETIEEQAEVIDGMHAVFQREMDAWAEAQEEVQRLRETFEGDEFRQALLEAQMEAEAAEELLDQQTQELNAARQEAAQLRRELARLGSSFDLPPVVEDSIPESWEEVFRRVSGLEYVMLGDVENEVAKLRGQDQEKTWVRRSWESIRALEEYARLKKERGADVVPHFRAYLQDPTVEWAIPATRYSSTESYGVMNNTRFRAARVLPVPRQVDESGQVTMEAHIRIGSGKPPAPRMHFHDDTSGKTGRIYVGHLGPHLPNWKTN